jgi:excisionase family DNA binding protein
MGGHSLHEMHEPHEPPLLTADAVGRLLGVDPSTVYRMAGDGRLPALRVGRQWRFAAEQVRAALAAGVPSHPEARPTDRGDQESAPPWTDPEAVADLVEVVADALGVAMVVTDLEGRPLTRVLHPCARLAPLTTDADLQAACAAEWRALDAQPDLVPRFRTGALGFDCARALVRRGDRLVGMVLAGGVAPSTAAPAAPTDGLHHLDDQGRARVLEALPRIAAALSRLAAGALPTAEPTPEGVTA